MTDPKSETHEVVIRSYPVSNSCCNERMDAAKQDRISTAKLIEKGHTGLQDQVKALEDWNKTLIVLVFGELITLVISIAGMLFVLLKGGL